MSVRFISVSSYIFIVCTGETNRIITGIIRMPHPITPSHENYKTRTGVYVPVRVVKLRIGFTMRRLLPRQARKFALVPAEVLRRGSSAIDPYPALETTFAFF